MDAEELPDADLEIGATKSNRMVFASGSVFSSIALGPHRIGCPLRWN
jgi:hypothetical protein